MTASHNVALKIETGFKLQRCFFDFQNRGREASPPPPPSSCAPTLFWKFKNDIKVFLKSADFELHETSIKIYHSGKETDVAL